MFVEIERAQHSSVVGSVDVVVGERGEAPEAFASGQDDDAGVVVAMRGALADIAVWYDEAEIQT